MALDTRDKRGSSIGLGLILVLPLANGAIDQGDRQQTAHSYRGILAVIPPSPPVADGVTVSGQFGDGVNTSGGFGDGAAVTSSFGTGVKVDGNL